MTMVRIFALSMLLGVGAGGVVWFAWGAITNVFRKREPNDGAAQPKPAAHEGKRAPAK